VFPKSVQYFRHAVSVRIVLLKTARANPSNTELLRCRLKHVRPHQNRHLLATAENSRRANPTIRSLPGFTRISSEPLPHTFGTQFAHECRRDAGRRRHLALYQSGYYDAYNTLGVTNMSKHLREFLPPQTSPSTRIMLFVDGENLAIRYGAMLKSNPQRPHVEYVPNVIAWSHLASRRDDYHAWIRRHYYTCVKGDLDRKRDIELKLRGLGFEVPRVFLRSSNGRSKQVDMALAVEMLSLAYEDAYDMAILVAGDADYIPLIEKVRSLGKRTVVWFVGKGMSRDLFVAPDHFWNMGELLFADPSLPGIRVRYGPWTSSDA
jgi:uncharacterized LabA/DUF88 family protein